VGGGSDSTRKLGN